MTKEQVLDQIHREFDIAAGAQKGGNEGMVRVCARRAAGAAIGFWLSSHPEKNWGTDAMNRLRSLQLDQTIPASVVDAAVRLTAKITEQFRSPFPTDPITDSRIIIDYFMER